MRTSPTGTGVVAKERSAAAAAALERLALEARLARKACTAAVDAAALGGALGGWQKEHQCLLDIKSENYGSSSASIIEGAISQGLNEPVCDGTLH